ncbi:RHS repeat-associated core domain-containing protein [Ramlibacter sp. WS9]|uniref:RHS repeat-associated core domain-containing protein n=1 Tax=Ramlibacter sp. WS9 TaxID=1882741 RepID=UPI0013054523|nr:RHS repeat-associated core domain-containing protein [Ramlibacter sp. WS9]
MTTTSIIRRTALAALLPMALAFALPLAVQAQGNSGKQNQIDTTKSQAAAHRGGLAAQRAWLQGKSLPATALARHDQLAAEFERRAAEFERVSNAWKADPSEAKLRELDALLAQYKASGKAPVLPAKLPWGAPVTNPRLPAETKTAWYRILTRDERVQLAQAGLTTVGGIRFTTVPEAGEAPQDADLAETGEVVLTAAIRAKAQELGKNPVNIFNWVRANVQFAPTWGATQTADATLRSLRGNATDTASLTIALLRASGIPARYQFGTVDVPAATAMNWLGGLAQPEAAIGLLQQGGIAARGISEAGQIKTIRMEHVWVSAYVNWAPSRGARDGGAALSPPQHPSPNAPLNLWVPLDASFKQHQFTAGLDLATVAPFNVAGAIDTARQGATCTAASAAQVNQAALAAQYAQFKTQAQQQLTGLGNDSLVSQILGKSAIGVQPQPLLAGTLAFPTVAANTAVPALTPSLRWRLQLSLTQGLDSVLSLDKPLPELEGQPLSLSFVPETEADAQALAALLRPGAGGDAATGLPTRIAAYLVKVKAQLRLGNQVVAEGGSFTLGQPLTLRTLLQNPEGNAGASEATVTAGETHVWAVQGQAQSAAMPAAAAQRLAALRTQLDGAQLPSGFDQASQLLWGTAAAFQASLDAKSRLYQRAAGAVETRLPGVTRASSRFETEEAFGLVLNVRPAGVGLHADRLGAAVASRTAATAPGYSRQSLERASAESHALLNRLFGAGGAGAQSALSGLAAAAAQGQTIWRADATTIDQVRTALDPESTVRAQVDQAVANGMQALVAQNYADLGGLPMDPLVVLDAQSGSAGYSVTSRNIPVVQLAAQRPGLTGWLGLADAQASKVLTAPALDAAVAQLNTAQSLLGDIDTQRWQAFAGQGEVLDGVYTSRLVEAASTANACDWLISTLGSQLGSGLPGTSALNRAPVIASTPVTTAQADLAYSYAVSASDADGDALAYSLNGAPSGMTISNTGLVSWPRPVAGSFALTLQVSDGKAIAQQNYTLTVSAAGAGLNVGLALNPSIANPGQTVTLIVSAASTNGAVTRTATIDGVNLPLDAQGVAVFTAPASGAHPIVVNANDGKSTVSREAILTVKDASDTVAPTAAIASPEADAGLRGVVNITGTATDARFAYYKLLLRRVGESDFAWQEIGRGLTQVSNGTLGQIDTSRYQNGLYQIGLFVVDVNGAQSSASVTVEFLGNLKLGQFRLSFADVRAEAPGVPLMLTRTYDSTKKDVFGDFGWGWSASGQDITVRKNMALGLSWVVETRTFQNCLFPLGKRRITISLPDGGMYRFDARNAVECSFAVVPEPDVQFDPVPGPIGGSSGGVNAAGQLKVIDGALVQARGGMLIDEEGNPWNPKDFELTTGEGFKYQLREGVGILNVTDPYGNKVTYGANGYSHSANLSVTLTRDAQGRITRATDPNGKSLAYAYNSQGELESVTDRDGKVTKFSYATVAGANTGATSGNADMKHLLASITDPRGQVVMSNQFDEYGRLTGTADALGQASKQEFDAANFKQTVTDRRGNKTVYTFDGDGNITQSVNALGQTTTFTFDANGNETRVTNALGEKTERTFDPVTGTQTSEKNHLGHTTRTGYSMGKTWQRLNPVSTTDARGNTTSISYVDPQQPGATPIQIGEPLGRITGIGQDVKGNPVSLNVAGVLTSFSYDGQGRKTQETNGLGQKTTYAYDTNGNETSRTVFKSVNGATVTFTTTKKYDSEKRVIEETDALGGKRTTTYDAAGKVATQTDAKGQVTTYAYDANARLTKTTYPDGTSDNTAYDGEGNEIVKTDRQGRSTRMEYDALNRLGKTTYPDGSSDSIEYDAAGRTVATVDRNGKRSTMEYDAAGRQTASVDATGRRTSQTYDENSNRTSVTVDGRTTGFIYDALNRLTKITLPDGSTQTTAYRTDNRKQSETDPRGVVTSYGYDLAGRLTSVAQSLSVTATATTTYGYDESGAKIKQVDALGRTTTWSLDGNGRITGRTIQDGTTESSQYDIEGNRLTKKTFAGETLTFQYGPENRLTGQVVPAGTGGNSAVPSAAISYSYTAGGQLESQQEQGPTTLGGTQTYRYDANGRLVQVKSLIGQISYSLDANGAVVERSIDGVGTTKNEYDAAGRLAKVAASDGKQARYTYDQAGRITTVERDLNAKDGQTQVLVSYNRYDGADRVVALAEVKRIGMAETLVAGQALTRNAGGTISKIETHRAGSSYDSGTGQFTGVPATTQAFEYDGNARLTRETRVQGSITVDTAYEYDAVGNRTKKTVSTAAGTEITTYTYDAADRLTQESTSLAAGGNRLTVYTWDGNGNLASKAEPGKVTLNRFDPENRLIDMRNGATLAQAQAAAPGVTYAYDAAGNRVKKGGALATSYLIDSSHSYAQLALESRAGETTAYVRGIQLVRQTKINGSATQDLFPLHGHLGTSMGAIDADGNSVEQIDVDAFGNLYQSAEPQQTHLYTGEYWDQDAQLVYLRARWYDPRIGRFVSADPFEGKQQNPRSLNRYSYADAEPIHHMDPSGKMSLGDVGSAMSTMVSLSMRAYDIYSFVSMLVPDEDDDTPDGKPTLWDGMMAEVIRSTFGSASSIPDIGLAAAFGGGWLQPKHHTIPEYMCGAGAQERVKLSFSDHSRLHTQLYGLHLSVKVLSTAYDLLFRKKKKKENMSPIAQVARTHLGRYAISEGLHAFYEAEGYWTMGVSETGPAFGHLGSVFLRERARYIRNHHSFPACKKQ